MARPPWAAGEPAPGAGDSPRSAGARGVLAAAAAADADAAGAGAGAASASVSGGAAAPHIAAAELERVCADALRAAAAAGAPLGAAVLAARRAAALRWGGHWHAVGSDAGAVGVAAPRGAAVAEGAVSAAAPGGLRAPARVVLWQHEGSVAALQLRRLGGAGGRALGRWGAKAALFAGSAAMLWYQTTRCGDGATAADELELCGHVQKGLPVAGAALLYFTVVRRLLGRLGRRRGRGG